MSDRATLADVRAAFSAHVCALQRCGLLPADQTAVLVEGSAANGRAFRVFTMRRGSSAHYRPVMGGTDGYLGMTKREAVDRLHTLTGAAYEVHYALSEAGRLCGCRADIRCAAHVLP